MQTSFWQFLQFLVLFSDSESTLMEFKFNENIDCKKE